MNTKLRKAIGIIGLALPFAGFAAFTDDTTNITLSLDSVADVELNDVAFGSVPPDAVGFVSGPINVCLASNTGSLDLSVISGGALNHATLGSIVTIDYEIGIEDAGGIIDNFLDTDGLALGPTTYTATHGVSLDVGACAVSTPTSIMRVITNPTIGKEAGAYSATVVVSVSPS